MFDIYDRQTGILVAANRPWGKDASFPTRGEPIYLPAGTSPETVAAYISNLGNKQYTNISNLGNKQYTNIAGLLRAMYAPADEPAVEAAFANVQNAMAELDAVRPVTE